MKTAEVELAFSDYMAERRGPNNDWKPGTRANTRNRLLPFAETFVGSDFSIANGFGLIATVEKILRRMRDVFEERINKIREEEEKKKNEDLGKAKEQELPGFGQNGVLVKEPSKVPITESPSTGLIEACPAGMADVLMIEIRNMCETQREIVSVLRDLNKTLNDAFFVKQGDLKFKNGNPKHVGWSWFHSLHSEAAQIRGLMAQGKPQENAETAEDLAEALSQEMKGNKEKAQNG